MVEIIAELSGNHLGSLQRALLLMQNAKRAGATAFKLQTFAPEEMAPPKVFLSSGPWRGHNLRELYRDTHIPWDWYRTLFDEGQALGIEVFSSPFNVGAVKFLENWGCPRYKIASPEIVDLELIAAAASTGKPLIISTGMATLEDIERALEAGHKAPSITLLHCISAYPAAPEDFNLATLGALRARFGLPVGLSSHSLSLVPAVTAVALGATMIEQHFTLARAEGGPDAAFSLESHELAMLVAQCHMTEKVIGTPLIGVRSSETDSVQYKRSIWVRKELKAGEIVTRDHLSVIRPASGLPPHLLPQVIGKRARQDVSAWTPLSLDLIQ